MNKLYLIFFFFLILSFRCYSNKLEKPFVESRRRNILEEGCRIYKQMRDENNVLSISGEEVLENFATLDLTSKEIRKRIRKELGYIDIPGHQGYGFYDGNKNNHLHWRITNDDTKEAKEILLKLGENGLLKPELLNRKDERGKTPLFFAIGKKYMETGST